MSTQQTTSKSSTFTNQKLSTVTLKIIPNTKHNDEPEEG